MNKRIAVVGPRLRRLLVAVLFLFACLSINSIYLGAVTLIEWLSAEIIQNLFYQWMFLAHLVLGLILVLPTLAYGFIHWRNAHGHRNRRAVKAGYALFGIALLLLISGLTLTRGLPLVELRDPAAREFAYWLHIGTPFVLVWLFILHRLAGQAIRWRSGAWVLGIATLVSVVSIVVQSQDPRRQGQAGLSGAEQHFTPSLARTSDGGFIEAESLMMDDYCQECHQDVHLTWAQSMHRFSSFNNPVYSFSVTNTRDFLQQRDGDTRPVRLCAACHDLVPLFAGALENADFENLDEDMANAGITCSACHAITHVNSTRGNADYTIEAPQHYPFTNSEQQWLQWVNRTLVKAKPAFHKKTFLKPLHKSAEFCSTCHKVALPEALNGYRWLRGQNHYDSFLLSGVSGHGVRSFYYPDAAVPKCASCHMPLMPSDDFAAQHFSPSTELSVHNHQFPAANTAIPHLLDLPEWVNRAHEAMLNQAVRVDIFGIREAGRIDGELTVLNGTDAPSLQPGKQYLIEVVLRTLKPGHQFTQGTSDSNEVWLNLVAEADGAAIGESGALHEQDLRVDPRTHFVNAYVIDREGRRIDRRNPEDIFTQLYNNQIPPGASDVVHYLLTVPESLQSGIELQAALKYRKFDTQLLQHMQGEQFKANDLPVTVMATDRVLLSVATGTNTDTDTTAERSSDSQSDGDTPAKSAIPAWQRWNDYGIGLLRREQFRQAEEAFKVVEAQGRGDGALNLARVYLREGRLDEAADALNRATTAHTPAPAWTISYFTAQLNLQNGYIDEAIAAFRELVATRFPEARRRGFDFSYDYRLLNDLALALAERAKFERGPDAAERAAEFRQEAVSWYRKTLAIDPENVTAHYGLAQLFEQLGEGDAAAHHRGLHARHKVDDNATDRAVQMARKRDPAADRAANKVVIYQLQTEGVAEPRHVTP